MSHPAEEHHVHPPQYYIKIWLVLLVLLAISILGPTLEIQWVTLITAFGIALVKAYLVVSRFMHLDIEKKIAHYILGVALLLMGVFYAGTAADVMRHDGQNWDNQAAKHEVETVLKEQGEDGHH